MQSVMAMHEKGSAQLSGEFGQLRDSVRWYAIVSKWQMHVAQSVFPGAFDVRLTAVHADNGLNSQLRQGGETFVAFGLRSGEDSSSGAEGIVDALQFDALKHRVGRDRVRGARRCDAANRGNGQQGDVK
jgi:hypothetical protein